MVDVQAAAVQIALLHSMVIEGRATICKVDRIAGSLSRELQKSRRTADALTAEVVRLRKERDDLLALHEEAVMKRVCRAIGRLCGLVRRERDAWFIAWEDRRED